jgi:hypothetical protein
MSRLWPLFSILLLLLHWLAGAPSPVYSQNTDVVLQVSPDSLEVAVGETIDVAVAVQDVTGLYGFDITVGFDPAMVEVVDFDPSQEGVQVALGLFLDPGFVIFNLADNNLGQLRLVMTQLNPSEAKSGSGNLLVIRFRALQAGQTPLLLVAGELAQRDGTTFLPELVNGQLTAVTTTLPLPSNTPIPTRLAGTPLPTTTPALLAVTGTPRVTQAATAVPPTATPPPPTATRQPASLLPTASAQPTLPGSTTTEPVSTAVQAEASQMTPTPETLTAPNTDAAPVGGTQDEEAFGATPATAIAEAGGMAAATAVPTLSMIVIGSDANVDGEELGAAAAAPAENSSQNPGIQVFLIVSGLLLVIVAFFYFISRKRQPGD